MWCKWRPFQINIHFVNIYNHPGYKYAKDEACNKEREAQKLIKGN